MEKPSTEIGRSVAYNQENQQLKTRSAARVQLLRPPQRGHGLSVNIVTYFLISHGD